MNDVVTKPNHYRSANGIEVIDVVDGFDLNANMAKAVEYILRADRKGEPIKDLEKAVAYLDREIERRQHARDGIPYLPLGRGFRSVSAMEAEVGSLQQQLAGVVTQVEALSAQPYVDWVKRKRSRRK